MRRDPYQEVPLGYAQELGLFPNALGNHEKFLRECWSHFTLEEHSVCNMKSNVEEEGLEAGKQGRVS